MASRLDDGALLVEFLLLLLLLGDLLLALAYFDLHFGFLASYLFSFLHELRWESANA